MENIKDKLRKLYNLVTRGEEGEAKKAKAILEKHLAGYGMTLEDILQEDTCFYELKYSNRTELMLLNQMLRHSLSEEEYKEARINKKSKIVFVDLTNIRYVEISDQWKFYRSLFRKELDKVESEFLSAFVYKHDLYADKDKDNDEDEHSKDVDLETVLRILRMAGDMDDITYRKKLESK